MKNISKLLTVSILVANILMADDGNQKIGGEIAQTTPEFTVPWKVDVDWTSVIGLPPIDDALAGRYIGKTIWITASYKDKDNKIQGFKHWAGTIKSYSRADGIRVELFDSDEIVSVPPFITPAKTGIYRLNSGREVHNPDYSVTWICRQEQ